MSDKRKLLTGRGPNGGRELTRGEKAPPNNYYVAVSGCWIWSGSKTRHGYGQIRYNGKQTGTHRAFYAHYVGTIPAGHIVMHSCDQPSCVNPDHLVLGTAAENMRDMNEKGRTGGYRSHLGDRHKKAKLTTADIPVIRERIAAGETNAAIAADYDVSATAIWQIKTGKAWKHA